MFEKQLNKLQTLLPVIKATDDQQLMAMGKFLYDRITHPDSYVVFIGETSSGKSTVINSLIQESLLPVSASPTTGTVIETEFREDIESTQFLRITKEASFQKIERLIEFNHLAKNPTSDTARLKIIKKANANLISGMRLFDTPGYNSIIESHTEILKDFLPNADVVVYTIGYKIGIQNEDFIFMRYLRELLRPDTPIIIVVNRCPESVRDSNPRIQEIKKYTKDLLGFEPQLSIVYQDISSDENKEAMPDVTSLQAKINEVIDSPTREKLLADAFDLYITDLFESCDSLLKTRLLSAKISRDGFDNLVAESKAMADKLEEAIPTMITPCFDNIRRVLPGKFHLVCNKVGNNIADRISNASKFDKEETIAFVNSYLLPHQIKLSANEEIQNYIDVELTDLNNRIDDYIQKETIKYENTISIILDTALDKASGTLLKKYATRTATNGLTQYVAQFGGMGGVNAGIANAASHLLKKVGDFFGKTFSRATHNTLKHTLAKIGATSIKAVGVAIAVIGELAFETWDLTHWQSKCKRKVSQALKDWEKDSLPTAIKDIDELESQNISTIREIAQKYRTMYDGEKPHDYEDALRKSNIADEWKNSNL